jgi:hypothetical protein
MKLKLLLLVVLNAFQGVFSTQMLLRKQVGIALVRAQINIKCVQKCAHLTLSYSSGYPVEAMEQQCITNRIHMNFPLLHIVNYNSNMGRVDLHSHVSRIICDMFKTILSRNCI